MLYYHLKIQYILNLYCTVRIYTVCLDLPQLHERLLLMHPKQSLPLPTWDFRTCVFVFVLWTRHSSTFRSRSSKAAGHFRRSLSESQPELFGGYLCGHAIGSRLPSFNDRASQNSRLLFMFWCMCSASIKRDESVSNCIFYIHMSYPKSANHWVIKTNL